MARPRLKKNQGLPPNLVHDVRNGQYRYRNVQTGKFHQMGNQRSKAISAAKQLNSILMPECDLVKAVLGEKKTLKQFIDGKFLTKHLPDRKLSDKTKVDYLQKLVHIKKKLGGYAIDQVSVTKVAEFLDEYPNVQSNRYRSLLVLIFNYAKAGGLVNDNVAEATMPKREDKDRERLTIEGYQKIYEAAGTRGLVWMQNAMDIGLVTLQRQKDILNMKFSDIIKSTADESGAQKMRVIQSKTKECSQAAYIEIAIGEKFASIIERCRDSILSPYLIHRVPVTSAKSKNRDHRTKILARYLMGVFAEIRDSIPMFAAMPKKKRPTFHEIRSLGIARYSKMGIDPQQLAGHTTAAMTDQYKKGHEVEWVQAASL